MYIRALTRPVSQAAKTSASHAENTSSILVRVTIKIRYIWGFSSVGQSYRLITGRSRVRVPESPPLFFNFNRGIAQQVEQRSPKPRAEGSIPSAPAKTEPPTYVGGSVLGYRSNSDTSAKRWRAGLKNGALPAADAATFLWRSGRKKQGRSEAPQVFSGTASDMHLHKCLTFGVHHMRVDIYYYVCQCSGFCSGS